jgi:hypothetical protein
MVTSTNQDTQGDRSYCPRGDTEQLRDLTGRIVVELEFHYVLSMLWRTQRISGSYLPLVACRPMPEMLGWGRFWRCNFSEAL